MAHATLAGTRVFGTGLTMQFVQHGPDIPDALLQAHEEGRVVFFCGAGERPDEIEAEVLKNKQFDQAVGRLETRIQGGRQAVRRSLPSLLHPDLTRTRALTTHLALLTLGRRPDGEF